MNDGKSTYSYKLLPGEKGDVAQISEAACLHIHLPLFLQENLIFSFLQDFDGAQLLDFHVSYPKQPTLRYQMKLGDETLQAPMGVFYPQVFGVVNEKMVYIQQRNQGDPEDIHDELYLLQTQSQQQQVCYEA